MQQVLHQYKRCHGSTLTSQSAASSTTHSSESLAQALEARNRLAAAGEPAAVEVDDSYADSGDIQGTHISYTADGIVDRGVVPREFEGVLRVDLAAVDRGRDKQGGAAAIVIDDDSSASEMDSVRLFMEVLEPYWSSALRIVKPQTANTRADGPYAPFFVAELLTSGSVSISVGRARVAADHFEAWVHKWCRYLVNQLCSASIGRHELWEACRTAVATDIGTALFLLPYAVRDALMHGGERMTYEVLAEVRAVLAPSDGETGFDALLVARDGVLDDDLASQTSGFRHRAIQACFALIDTIRKWQAGTAFPSAASAGKPFPTSCRGADTVSRLLSAVPHHALATAAVQVRAHTRALMHLEMHLRELNAGAHNSARFLQTTEDTGEISGRPRS